MQFRSTLGIAVLFLLSCRGSTPVQEVTPKPEGTAAPAAEAPAEQTQPQPHAQPTAAANEHVEEIFGVKVADPHRWLENVQDDAVKSWMAEKDSAARRHFAELPTRDLLEQRLREIYYVAWTSSPIVRGKRIFHWQRAAEQEKAAVYQRLGKKGTPKLLLDPNTMSADGSVSLGGFYPTWDGEKAAYLLKANNADDSTLYVMNVESGQVSEIDTIPHLRYTAPSWTPDGRGFYYTWAPNDPNIKPADRFGYAELRYHQLGTDPAKDPTVHEKTGDPTKFLGGWVSRDGKYLFATVSRGWSANDVYVKFLADKDQSWRTLIAGTSARYMVDVWKDKFYIHTDEDAARGRIFVADAKKLDRKDWKEIVSEDPNGVLQSVSIVGGHLGISYLKNASSELQIRSLQGKLVRVVSLPSIGTSSGLSGLEDDDTAYFAFTSFLQPEEIYSTSVKTGKTELYAKVEVAIDRSKFELTQVWFPSKDGTKISMFILHAKGLEKNGDHPAVLYGYGGFNISQTPEFKPAIYTWLEQGGVYAIVNLRGGGEYGEEWHRAGMLEKKQNSFDDFYAAAEYLIAQKYTRADRLAASGRSNGGLLVGVAMTQRPDLFRAIVCGVPLLDMVRYPLVGIGKAWMPEYGDPSKKEHFEFLYAYSPYHRLEADTNYPALLLSSVDSDDRVDPMHARKFMAAIEAVPASKRTKLLRIEKNAGHGGADLRKAAVSQAADELAFLLSELGGSKAKSEPASGGSSAK